MKFGACALIAVTSIAACLGFVQDLGWDDEQNDQFLVLTSRRFYNYTYGEVRKMFGAKLHPPNGSVQTELPPFHTLYLLQNAVSPLPSSFDSREVWPDCGVIHAVRDQLLCGDCFLMAPVESLGISFCVQSAASVDLVLSEEHVLSCEAGNNGCDGGFMLEAWRWLSNNGTVSASCRPYTGTAQDCLNQCVNEELPRRFKARTIKTARSDSDIMRGIMEQGSVTSFFLVYKDLLDYEEGIYSCKGKRGNPLGHAVLIVGWGTDSGEDYWLIRNSWGSHWGESGFFRVSRAHDSNCGVSSASQVDLPIIGYADLSLDDLGQGKVEKIVFGGVFSSCVSCIIIIVIFFKFEELRSFPFSRTVPYIFAQLFASGAKIAWIMAPYNYFRVHDSYCEVQALTLIYCALLRVLSFAAISLCNVFPIVLKKSPFHPAAMFLYSNLVFTIPIMITVVLVFISKFEVAMLSCAVTDARDSLYFIVGPMWGGYGICVICLAMCCLSSMSKAATTESRNYRTRFWCLKRVNWFVFTCVLFSVPQTLVISFSLLGVQLSNMYWWIIADVASSSLEGVMTLIVFVVAFDIVYLIRENNIESVSKELKTDEDESSLLINPSKRQPFFDAWHRVTVPVQEGEKDKI